MRREEGRNGRAEEGGEGEEGATEKEKEKESPYSPLFLATGTLSPVIMDSST